MREPDYSPAAIVQEDGRTVGSLYTEHKVLAPRRDAVVGYCLPVVGGGHDAVGARMSCPEVVFGFDGVAGVRPGTIGPGYGCRGKALLRCQLLEVTGGAGSPEREMGVRCRGAFSRVGGPDAGTVGEDGVDGREVGELVAGRKG